MSRRTIGWIIATLLTTAGMVFLLRREALGPVLAGLASADPRILLLALPLVVILQFARAGRFILLLDQVRDGGLIQSFRISCLHIALSFLLPFKLGEAAFPLLARRLIGVDLMAGTGALLTVRLMDLGTLGALLAISAGFAVPSLWPWRWLLVLLALPALASPWLILVLGHLGQRRSGRLATAGAVLDKAKARHTFGLVTLLTIVVWVCHATVAWLAFQAVGVPASLPVAVFAGASANVAFALPFQGIAGLGPVQAAFAYAAHLGGVPLDPAITVALAAHATLFVFGCLLALLALASEPRLRFWRTA